MKTGTKTKELPSSPAFFMISFFHDFLLKNDDFTTDKTSRGGYQPALEFVIYI